VGFFRAVEVAAERLGVTLEALLSDTETITYSTTVGTNTLIERSGPRLGVITTMGFENTLQIGRGRSWADGLPTDARYERARAQRPEPLVPQHLVVGLRERIDSLGRVLMPLRDEDVLEQVQRLVDQGVRGFVVSTIYSYVNPVHELRVRELIRAQYPEAYLGHMPVFLSSEVSPQMGEYRRTVTCILDAFLRMDTEDHLVALNHALRERGYRKPLLIAKCTGGASSLSRTRPIQLFGSGPVASIIGSVDLAKRCGIANALITDMGGTSFDLGMIVEDKDRPLDLDPIIDRWRVQIPLVSHWSIGAGGGSIARVEHGILYVGPQSARALPGPACYARGGELPTVTDSDVVLGYIDPNYFLGGRIKLDAARAAAAIESKVARPLGMDLHAAAWGIKQIVDGIMGQEIHRIAAMTSGLDPREFTIFAYGGAGPVHAAGFAEAADVTRVVNFPFGSVAGAFGALHLDIMQVYERSYQAMISTTERRLCEECMPALNAAVDGLVALGRRDMAEEGLSTADVVFQLELSLRFGQQRHSLSVSAQRLRFDNAADLQSLVERFVGQYRDAYGAEAAFLEAGVEILGLRLNAVRHRAKPSLPRVTMPSRALQPKGSRQAYWGPEHGLVDTMVYQREDIAPGTALNGPVLIETMDTVLVVPPEWRFKMDEQLTGWMERS